MKLNDYERQVLRSLQFLLAKSNPESERYKNERDDLLVKNHLLLNPIETSSINKTSLGGENER